MRVHLEVEWLDGNELDDDTLYEVGDDEVAGAALEAGYLVFGKEPDDTELSSYTIINLAATKRVDVRAWDEGPQDAAPVDAV